MRALLAAAATLLMTACTMSVTQDGAAPVPDVSVSDAHIQAALADARRPEADRARDAQRHPADILAFAGVRPGQAIADVGPGGGYYTRLFAVAVGDAGKVYGIIRPPAPDAANPPRINAVVPDYANVVVIPGGYQAWTAPEPLDVIFISQIYHDFHLPRLEIDIAAANRNLFNALKPGGALIVIDHAAIDGSDLSVTDTLHRIDQATLRREIEAAGFVFNGETQVLRNPADDRTLRVFEGAVQGHTDQFAMRFTRP
jgi:predicted methyltransferase